MAVVLFPYREQIMKFNKIPLPKSQTGVQGLDEITHGGLPKGRTTLVSGSAGAGKTVLAMEFLVHGILDYDEPGVFIAFEETEQDLTENVASFGYDLHQLQADGKLAIDHVHLDRDEMLETGRYDLEGLFIRLGAAVNSVGAKRVVLDTVEVLFASLQNQALIRFELLRLFRWLRERGLTAIVTGERGEGRLTRFGLEEYVADCVLLLDHPVTEQISTRRLRVLKYRGSLHEMDEHPFLMGEGGISVVPLTSAGLKHNVSAERVSSGVADLDQMMDGKGFFRGSSVLVSGTAGTGKSSLAFSFLQAACERGERALYFGFEESESQSIRNMLSIGINLQLWIDRGLLHFHTIRPSSLGLEAHLASIHQAISAAKPRVLAMDPISVFMSTAEANSTKSMLTRLVDFLKMEQVSALFTHLSHAADDPEKTEGLISSIMDTWLMLRDREREGYRTTSLNILKSRGMAHSRQDRNFILSVEGIRLGGDCVTRLKS
jgi:circadian clock protein KaiC